MLHSSFSLWLKEDPDYPVDGSSHCCTWSSPHLPPGFSRPLFIQDPEDIPSQTAEAPMGQCWTSCGHQSSCHFMHADTWRAGHQQSIGGLHWGLLHRGASLIEKESLQDLAQGGGCCQNCGSDINKGYFPGPQLPDLGAPGKDAVLVSSLLELYSYAVLELLTILPFSLWKVQGL